MSLYVRTPMSQLAARRMAWNRAMEQWAEAEPRVFFPIDIHSEGDDYIITALLPGVKAEDLKVQAINDTITLQGEFKKHEDENVTTLRCEIPTGRFFREITLPDPLDTGKVEAHLKDGVLSLRVPKAEQAKPKSIKIVSR